MNLSHTRLLKEDLDKSCKELALYLLGKILVRKLEDNIILKGRIVETESYLGGEDKASHSYNGRRTKANEPMYMPPGTCYVYMTYGMYHCFNVSSREPGAAVLLRALQPLAGFDVMEKHRAQKHKSIKNFKPAKLCDGPSKLCIAMDITKEYINKLDLTDLKNNNLWLEDDSEFEQDFTVVHSARIGIKRAEEWNTKPLRFYILNNDSVSKCDKAAELQYK
ncbi:unnamed protein product [Diabrotica balteata]|uniref:DNA-3-methyladenine glycosylase n=1 Tax=Diabrotica balteata TaxID=107213 RepID=A0A9P0GTQ8_DIABA|nr:unnamed protein product [Diabrotica balteata]